MIPWRLLMISTWCEQDGWTALMHATQNNRGRIVMLLLEKGADPLSENKVS